MSTIQLMHQTLPNNCTATSLAMLFCACPEEREFYESVFLDFHKQYAKGLVTPMDLLNTVYTDYELLPHYAVVSASGLYLLSVPSLNYPGLLHNLLLLWEDGKATVYDPAYLSPNSYSLDPEQIANGARDLRTASWVPEIRLARDSQHIESIRANFRLRYGI